jgi:hypothetical protein
MEPGNIFCSSGFTLKNQAADSSPPEILEDLGLWGVLLALQSNK